MTAVSSRTVLGGVLVLALLGASGASAAVQISVSDFSGPPGAAFTVPVRMENGSGVLGYFFELSFDGVLVEALGAVDGSLTSGWGPAVNILTDGVVVAASGSSAASGSGSLVVLQFRIKPSAADGQSSPLHFEAASLNDGAIPVTPVDGTVDVNVTIAVTANHTGDYFPGTPFVMPITLDDSTGILGYFFELSFDSSVLDYVSVQNGALASGWGTPMVNAQTGQIFLVGSHTAPLSGGGGTLVEVTLQVRSTATPGASSILQLAQAMAATAEEAAVLKRPLISRELMACRGTCLLEVCWPLSFLPKGRGYAE